MKRSQTESNTQIFIRSAERNVYLSHGDKWCPQVAGARCFQSALEAALVCTEKGLTRIQLVVHRRDKPPLMISL